ncbi:MFS transporter [Chloroflexota bacterium]
MQEEVLDYMHHDTEAITGIKRNRIITVSLVTLCRSFHTLSIGGIALFLPLIRKDLGLSFTQGGSLSAATTAVYALMQIPAGYLTDRFGPKRPFFIGVLGTTVLLFTFGLVSEYWQALVNQSLAGFFHALLFQSGLTLITEWFPPHRRATATALISIGALLGTIILSIVGPLLVVEFTWRFPFISFASVGIIASFIFLHFGKEPPLTGEQRKVTMREMLQLFRYRAMWVCGILQYIRLAVLQGVAFWLPSLLIDEKGLSLQITGLIIAVRAGFSAPSNVLGGYISDRLRNPTIVIGFSLIILAITTGLFTVTNNTVVLVALIFTNAVFVQMYFGPLFTVPVEILGTRVAGMSRGFSNFFANIGSLSFVYIMGALRDTTGSFRFGFYAIVVACVIGLVFTVLLAQIRHKAIGTST